MADTLSLPAGFEVLQPFVARWSVDGAANRSRLRLESTAEEREAFFQAASDLAAPALELLDRKPLDQLDPAERRLMNLLLSLVHVSLAVEIQGDQEAFHAQGARRIRINRAPSDDS